MNHLGIGVVVLAIIGLVLFVGCQSNKKIKSSTESPLMELRRTLLTKPLTSLDSTMAFGKNGVLGVLMEIGFNEGCMTILSLCDGTVSMYSNQGGGIIGAGEHESVRNKGFEFMNLADTFVPDSIASEPFPQPKGGEIVFYFITTNGIKVSKSSESSLVNSKVPLSQLFFKGNELISEIRNVSEAPQKSEKENETWSGNGGYVNCLLTALAEGTVKIATINSLSRPPSLLDFVGSNDKTKKWIAGLSFDYDKLDSKEICKIIVESAGQPDYKIFREPLHLQTLLVPPEGKLEGVPVNFKIENIGLKDLILKISVVDK